MNVAPPKVDKIVTYYAIDRTNRSYLVRMRVYIFQRPWPFARSQGVGLWHSMKDTNRIIVRKHHRSWINLQIVSK